MRILLVDESRAIRSVQKNVLRRLGYSDVIEAAGGAEGLDRFHEQAPDLTIVDWNMADMGGLTLVRTIRAFNQSAAIIMCMTEAEKPRVLEAIKAGVNNYIVKPFTVESLREKIAQTMTGAGNLAGAAGR